MVPQPLNLTLTLTLILLLLPPSLFAAAYPFFFLVHSPQIKARGHLPPSPSPSPSPLPATPVPISHQSLPLRNASPPDSKPCSRSIAGCPRHGPTRPPISPVRGDEDPPPGLNFGEKVGLAFLGVALALQVVLGGFLVYKRWQMWKLGVRLEKAPSSPSRVPAFPSA